MKWLLFANKLHVVSPVLDKLDRITRLFLNRAWTADADKS